MEQRLIDANEILKSEHQHYDYMSDEFYVTVRDIENAPTVDAVPVIRCKDCKYLNIINKAPVYACCSKHNHTLYLWEEDTRKHFCSWSERREDE